MTQTDQSESGYLAPPETDGIIGSEIRDVEVIRKTKINVVARGRRYGRLWLLKGLREDLRDSAVMQRQLLKEFEIQSRLRHPSVVQAIALEEVEGLGLCIVQEWVDGTTLLEALRKGNLSSSDKRRILRQLIETVAYLHTRGIVHRDLKPSNVMLRDIGKEIALIDYGLADTADYVEIKAPAGTPGFISPEQVESGGADPADDVYSLGVIMRELVPRFRRIARRCTGPVKTRPKDGGALLKLIDSRAKRTRAVLWIVAALLVIALAIVGIVRIRTLEKSSRAASDSFSQISDENTRNAALVSSLEDSLSTVKGNLRQANDELDKITKYENLKQSVIKEGCRMLDNIMLRQDKLLSADSAGPSSETYYKVYLSGMESGNRAVDEYCSSLEREGITPEDIEIINTTLSTIVR